MPEWAQDGGTDGKGIIGSQIYEYYVGRPDDGTAGGLVGSETNSDLPEYVEGLADPDGTETTITGSGQTDYDNSFTETEALYTAGYLTDCTVAISIDSDTAGAVDLDNIRQHAARAAGIVGVVDETTGEEYLADKISVLSMDFYDSQAVRLPDSRTVPLWVLLAASAGLLLFLLLLVIILLIRRRRRKKVDERKKQELDDMLVAAGFVPDVAAPAGADVMSLQTEKSMELRKDIRQFANDNPEIAAQMVRGWLRGGEMNG
jgi:flagellar M-ring protein FliF